MANETTKRDAARTDPRPDPRADPRADRTRPAGRRWRDAPSPCIGVCEYKRPRADGTRRCKGCALTRAEKSSWNGLQGKQERKPLLELVRARLLKRPRRLARWQERYRAKCRKRGVPCPLDRMDAPEGA